MKTAISVPDETFDAAERRAADLGMSRSEFFTRAAQHYLAHLEAESLSDRINEAIETAGADDSGHAAAQTGRRHLATGDDEW